MVSAAANGGSLCLFWSLSSLGDFDGVRFHGGGSCCVGGGRLSCNVVSPIWTIVTVCADAMVGRRPVHRRRSGRRGRLLGRGERTKYPLDLVINELRVIFETDGVARERQGELLEITAGSVAFNVTPLLFMTSPLSSFFPFAVLQDCPTISAQGFKDNAWRSSLVFGQRQAGPRISYEPKSRIGSPGRSGNDPGGPRASSCLPLCDLICCPLIALFLSLRLAVCLHLVSRESVP